MRDVASKYKRIKLNNRQCTAGVVLLLALIDVTCITGCTKVEPWEKGNFTKPSMSLEPWSIPAYMNNKTMEKALESSRGSVSLGGGGCGCG
ncbi:hypothetical protein Lmor_0574 [Legionella moravica]|uniref:DUF4266 domain-containing protein n=2 Tax=Legionellaceae TaxID=444 RepID=A0A378JYM5_9GAMM|nr:hypothetical protein Lmor_0574 [Legionella moravica]STX63140.1 Uncharacterised protein [Legionella moravica]